MGDPKYSYSKEVSNRIFNNNHVCFLCGKEIPKGERSKDHILPKSQGGSGGEDNIAIMCKSANQMFGNLPVKYKLQAIMSRTHNGVMRCPNPPEPNNEKRRKYREGTKIMLNILASFAPNNRPQNLKTLKNWIKDVDSKYTPMEIIKRLQSLRAIRIKNKKVTYPVSIEKINRMYSG